MNAPVIKLISCDEFLLEKILCGNEILAKAVNVKVPVEWSEFWPSSFANSLEKIRSNPNETKWWSWLPILIESNTLIGSCGYKGKPDENGMVEIGYEVAKDFRNRGYATEIARLLIVAAFKQKDVRMIQAHTLAEENASVKVLRKLQFEFVEEINDPDDGKIWKWTFQR